MQSPIAAVAMGALAASAAADLYQTSQRESQAKKRASNPNTPTVLVIGAGFSGLCSAIKLKEAGIPFRVFEKAADLGGTWYLNTYPGVACDVPAHGYSFSFELNPNWSTAFAPGHEIEEYIRFVARKYDVYKDCHFNHEVVRIEYDNDKYEWVVTYTVNGGAPQVTRAQILFNCLGGLHFPLYPPAEGVCNGTFKGAEMHSAEWNSKVDLTGKRVVVVGSAASAVQIVPEICDQVKTLTVLQRTPNWLAPQHAPFLPMRLAYGPVWRWMLNNVPGLLRLYRICIYWLMEVLHFPLGLFTMSSLGHRIATAVLTRYMKMLLKGNQELADKVIPKYPLGCKRIIRSEKFLPALLKPNVHLVTKPLGKVESGAVVTEDGQKIDADVIIYATGFKVGSLGKLKIVGSDGQAATGADLIDYTPPFYLGLVTPSTPNLFMMLGPNTALGHNSIILMIEAQVKYAVRMVCMMADQNIAEVKIKASEAEKFVQEIERGVAGSVWVAEGCHSWYQNKDGRVSTLWPFTTVKYIHDTAPPADLSKYEIKNGGGK